MDIYDYAEKNRSFLSQMPSFVGLATLNHKLAFVDARSAKLFGFKTSEDVAGIDYSNIKCKAAEDFELFYKQDKLVFSFNKKIASLGCHCYKDDNWKLILSEKSPVINSKNEVIGLINYWIDITNYNLIDFSRFILFSGNNFNQPNRRNFSYLIEDGETNHYKLSIRQTECLFFLVRGKSDKEIAKILQLSPRTVETYIYEIKRKMGCLNRSQVIEKSFNEGLVNILPKRFLMSANSGGNIILAAARQQDI